MEAPDPGFAFWSADSIHSIGLAECAAELRREASLRVDRYPALVARGRLSEMDAQAEIAIMGAMAAELSWAAMGSHGNSPINSYSWQQKIHCLRREINIRRGYYPKAVTARRMTIEGARLHLSAIEAAHKWYWHDGLNFMEGRRDGPLPYQAGDCGWNIRKELERREAWGIAHGYDLSGPAYCAGVYDGDWSAVPRIEVQAA